MEGYRITEEDVRKKMLEVLFPKNSSDSFAGTVEELKARVESVVDYIACIIINANKPQIVRPELERKCASAIVYSLLRSWITWGLSGPGLVEVTYELGPEIVRKRIEKVEICIPHRSGPAVKEMRHRPEAEGKDAVPAEAED